MKTYSYASRKDVHMRYCSGAQWLRHLTSYHDREAMRRWGADLPGPANTEPIESCRETSPGAAPRVSSNTLLHTLATKCCLLGLII